MFRKYFILFLLAHVLGDFYLQTDKVAEKKDKSISWVLFHSLCYCGVVVLFCLPIMSWEILLGVTFAGISHGIIDVTKYFYLSFKKKKKEMTKVLERNVFFADQLLHSIILIGISYWLTRNNVTMMVSERLLNFFNIIGVTEHQFIYWTLALLLVHKPANLIITKLLMIYKPETTKEDRKREKNAGRFIGTVERIIMLIFLYINQYSAIGLVLTAKSIARYDRITKEKDFAEYYLLGTLLSTLLVIIVSLIISS